MKVLLLVLLTMVPIIALFWIGAFIAVLQLYLDTTPRGERSLKEITVIFFTLPFYILSIDDNDK